MKVKRWRLGCCKKAARPQDRTTQQQSHPFSKDKEETRPRRIGSGELLAERSTWLAGGGGKCQGEGLLVARGCHNMQIRAYQRERKVVDIDFFKLQTAHIQQSRLGFVQPLLLSQYSARTKS
jgi:hypothetical protein